MNIAEILRKCPTGTKLYSPVFGEIVLKKVDYDEEYPITCITKKDFMLFLQAMVCFSAIIPILNVCFSPPKTNAIGASLKRVTKLLTKKTNLSLSLLTRCLCEIVILKCGSPRFLLY